MQDCEVLWFFWGLAFLFDIVKFELGLSFDRSLHVFESFDTFLYFPLPLFCNTLYWNFLAERPEDFYLKEPTDFWLTSYL